MQPYQALRSSVRNDYYALNAALILFEHHTALLLMRCDRDARVPYPAELKALDDSLAKTKRIFNRVRTYHQNSSRCNPIHVHSTRSIGGIDAHRAVQSTSAAARPA